MPRKKSSSSHKGRAERETSFQEKALVQRVSCAGVHEEVTLSMAETSGVFHRHLQRASFFWAETEIYTKIRTSKKETTMPTASPACSEFLSTGCAISWQMGRLQAEQLPSWLRLAGGSGWDGWMDGDAGHFPGIRDQLAEMLRATYPSQALIPWKCPIPRLIQTETCCWGAGTGFNNLLRRLALHGRFSILSERSVS